MTPNFKWPVFEYWLVIIHINVSIDIVEIHGCQSIDYDFLTFWHLERP